MTEDEIYRASTQYRLWNFTPEQLEERRNNTNALAIKQTRAAFRRKRDLQAQISSADASEATSEAEGNGNGNGTNGAAKPDLEEVECLTPDEEKKLVAYMCFNLLELVMEQKRFGELPIHVAGTAVQFLKRFYLSHSPIDYHPRNLLPTAIFLATKTENIYTSLEHFSEKLMAVPGFKKGGSTDAILAPEFILTQGLRFCFDVRHPFRALRGFYFQELAILKDIAQGGQPPPGFTTRPAKQIQEELLRGKTPQKFVESVEYYPHVKDTLQRAALLSDAYFLYTPAQIHFAAWYMHNPFILEYYIDLKLANSANPLVKDRLMEVIRNCAALLEESQKKGQEAPEEIARLNKKLTKCQNPDKKDLISLNKATKRDGVADGEISESQAKKRKLQREQNEKESEDLFGPALVKPEAA
ncbi:cyclin-like protein [Venturia nashicola]|nr:cyclin-like protein [Venturia nashicola]